MPVKYALVSCNTNYPHAAKQPTTLPVVLMRWFNIQPAVYGVQLVVNLPIQTSVLVVLRRLCSILGSRFSLGTCPSLFVCSDQPVRQPCRCIAGNRQVVASSICGKIHTIVVAESYEKGRVSNVAHGMLLSPQIDCWTKLASKVSTHDESCT